MNCGYEIKWSYDLRSYERNFSNCVEKPEKFRTSTGFEPVTSRFRCDALTNWAMKPLTLGAGHLWVLMVPWGMKQWWNDIWNESYMNCGQISISDWRLIFPFHQVIYVHEFINFTIVELSIIYLEINTDEIAQGRPPLKTLSLFC